MENSVFKIWIDKPISLTYFGKLNNITVRVQNTSLILSCQGKRWKKVSKISLQ